MLQQFVCLLGDAGMSPPRSTLKVLPAMMLIMVSLLSRFVLLSDQGLYCVPEPHTLYRRTVSSPTGSMACYYLFACTYALKMGSYTRVGDTI